MTQEQLQEVLTQQAGALDVPGVAVGVLFGGEAHYAFHGVTSVENPLPVDASTLFQFGSTGKTYTATAMLKLVDMGMVDLEAPVRRYVPELKLKDPQVAEQVTILQLFNHTAGWSGDLMDDTGDGDDALEKYVANMANIDQVTPLGETVSYNNASLALAGHVIARTLATTYEQAIKELLLEPLGLTSTYFFMTEIMTRRFVAGHRQGADGAITVARPWALPRGGAPAGGMSANAADQLAWARFHLGDGRAADGTRVLSKELLDLMKQPTVDMQGSALGDYVGISWLLKDIEGVRLVSHGGTTNGQHSAFVMVPERDFAFIAMTNCGPNGPQLNGELEKWALETYLGLVEPEPVPLALDEAALAQYAGEFETIAARVRLTVDAGKLWAQVEIKPEMLKVLQEQLGEDEVPAQPPIPLGILAGDGDRYVVTDGAGKGMRGYFARSDSGAIEGVHMGGRLATKVTASAPA